MADNEPSYEVYLLAIRSAIAALALAVIAASLIISDIYLGFFFMIFTLIVLVYSFISPIIWKAITAG